MKVETDAVLIWTLDIS